MVCDNSAKPLISVIVPAYNLENYIEKCIDSIQRQGRICSCTDCHPFPFRSIRRRSDAVHGHRAVLKRETLAPERDTVFLKRNRRLASIGACDCKVLTEVQPFGRAVLQNRDRIAVRVFPYFVPSFPYAYPFLHSAPLPPRRSCPLQLPIPAALPALGRRPASTVSNLILYKFTKLLNIFALFRQFTEIICQLRQS